jgi:hypothetical protein
VRTSIFANVFWNVDTTPSILRRRIFDDLSPFGGATGNAVSSTTVDANAANLQSIESKLG